MPRSGKITKIEKEKRINEVGSLLLMGANRANILKYAEKEGWNVSDRQVDNYIRDYKNRCIRMLEENLERERAVHIRRNELLFNKSYSLADYKTCLQIDKNIADLKGLYLQKVEHSGGVNVQMTLADWIKNINEQKHA